MGAWDVVSTAPADAAPDAKPAPAKGGDPWAVTETKPAAKAAKGETDPLAELESWSLANPEELGADDAPRIIAAVKGLVGQIKELREKYRLGTEEKKGNG